MKVRFVESFEKTRNLVIEMPDRNRPPVGDLVVFGFVGDPPPDAPFADEIDAAVAMLIDEGAGNPTESTGDPAGLQAFWGRPVLLDTLVDGNPTSVRGTLVGIGDVVSVLTVDGVWEIPAATILAVSDPESG